MIYQSTSDLDEICSYHCVGTDASYKGNHIASAAIIVITQGQLVYQNAWPCLAHSSFDGELQALLDAVKYIASHLEGLVIVISDNEAAIAAACNNSPHSGFASSLAICKLLLKWFQCSPRNQLQFRWFPGHEGLDINALADLLAGQELPCINPPIVATTASR